MGKTTLLERLLPVFRARGLAVSLIKHSHKNLDFDRPGKDSHRLREAGCQELLLMGRRQLVLLHELPDDDEPPLSQLLNKLQACDLVLIEGFKQGNFPKLEVWRAAVGKPSLWPELPGILAIATNDPFTTPGTQALALSDTSGIADFIFHHAADQSEAMVARQKK